MRRLHIVKVGDYWINLAEVLYVEPSEIDEADVRVHFRGPAYATGEQFRDHTHDPLDVPGKEFEEAVKRMSSRPWRDYEV